MKNILVINPGSTSTKVSLFRGDENAHTESINHPTEELKEYVHIADQFDFRKSAVLQWLESIGVKPEELSAVVGRGGMLRPIPAGTYQVSEQMKKDCLEGVGGEHASNLGALIASSIAEPLSIPAFIVDPVAVDEFPDVARISGLKEIPRLSQLHALNVRAIGLKHAKVMAQPFEESNFIIAHLGGGISVAAIKEGRIIDVNNANEMGPFSPERTGGLPVWSLAKLIFDGRFKDFSEVKKFLRGQGGLTAYLGTNDLREAERMIDDGHQQAKLIIEAMAYQIAKEIGASAAVLQGKVQAILLTGGIAYDERVTNLIKDMTSFIAPVTVYAGEDEMGSLAGGALRVLRGEEQVKNYDEEAHID